MTHVLIRADGGRAIGLGHVTRCLSIAAGLRELGARSSFVTAAPAPIVRKIAAAGHGVVRSRHGRNWRADARHLLRQIATLRADAVIIDSYGLGLSYQRSLRAARVPICLVDDRPGARVSADLVIDQRIGARAADYAADEETRFLLGPRYALLRPAFGTARHGRRPRSGTPRVLIMMGGSDPRGATRQVLAAVDSLPTRFAIDLVAGVAQRHLPRLAAAASAARHEARLHHDPEDLAGIMARSTIAVSAASGTCWELACLGVPTLILVTADNQRSNAAGLARSGFALSLGGISPLIGQRVRGGVDALLGDHLRLRRMSAAGRRLVDGRGAQRAAREVLRLIR